MQGLPETSVAYFWDVDVSSVDVDKDASFIIHRLLEWGDVEDIRWLLNRYPKNLLISNLQDCRSLNPKSAVFWALLLNVPLGELKCIQKPLRLQHKSV